MRWRLSIAPVTSSRMPLCEMRRQQHLKSCLERMRPRETQRWIFLPRSRNATWLLVLFCSQIVSVCSGDRGVADSKNYGVVRIQNQNNWLKLPCIVMSLGRFVGDTHLLLARCAVEKREAERVRFCRIVLSPTKKMVFFSVKTDLSVNVYLLIPFRTCRSVCRISLSDTSIEYGMSLEIQASSGCPSFVRMS